VADEVLVARAHADAALAAAPLIPVCRDRRPLDVAVLLTVMAMSSSVISASMLISPDSPSTIWASIVCPVADLFQLVDDDLHQQALAGENRAEPFNRLGNSASSSESSDARGQSDAGVACQIACD
jgi:hypothetical protein